MAVRAVSSTRCFPAFASYPRCALSCVRASARPDVRSLRVFLARAPKRVRIRDVFPAQDRSTGYRQRASASARRLELRTPASRTCGPCPPVQPLAASGTRQPRGTRGSCMGPCSKTSTSRCNRSTPSATVAGLPSIRQYGTSSMSWLRNQAVPNTQARCAFTILWPSTCKSISSQTQPQKVQVASSMIFGPSFAAA